MLEIFLKVSKKFMAPRCVFAIYLPKMSGGGDYHVLPPSVMLAEYPDAPIVITASPFMNKHKIQVYLMENLGIPKKRIVNYGVYVKKISCYYLDHFLLIGKDSCDCCCNFHGAVPVVNFEKGGNPQQKIAKYIDFRNNLKKALNNGEPCVCSGCAKLKLGWHLESPPLETIFPVFNSICNLRCFNCVEASKLAKKGLLEFDADYFTSMVQALRDEGLICVGTKIDIGRGEISIHPERKKILECFENMFTKIHSNCVVYDDHLAQRLKHGKCVLTCSVDAGTRETYTKIKGADRFDSVCENLKRYSQLAKIKLKYIFFEGQNDDNKNIHAFMCLASKLKPAAVIVSKDRSVCLSDYALKQMSKMIVEANKLGIIYEIDGDIFDDEKKQLECLIKEGLL